MKGSTKRAPSAAQHAAAGQDAARKGNTAEALRQYMQAFTLAPDYPPYALQLTALLDGISLGTFHPRLKTLMTALLKTQGINHQKLWKPWLELLLKDPNHQAFARAIKDGTRKAFQKLDDPFLLEGLSKLTVYDMDFERVIAELSKEALSYPPAFAAALNAYGVACEFVYAPAQEAAAIPIDQSIKTLSAPQGEASRAVQEQYEANPYPRWTALQRLPAAPHEPHRHLIAGCGTGFAAVQKAMLYPAAEFIAFDLCRASLSYAKAKAEECDIKNITFYQADILDLSELEGTFDIIESSGVLHHMDDPRAGWTALRDKLAPGGKMHIGLYSERARQDVIAARAIIAEHKIEPTAEGINEARKKIAALPEGHNARGVLSRPDFFNRSGCRDLIFHVMEHRFTPHQIAVELKALGLKFTGFNSLPAVIKAQYKKEFSDDQNMLNLDNWETFEKKNPDSFRAMYQFWCTRC